MKDVLLIAISLAGMFAMTYPFGGFWFAALCSVGLPAVIIPLGFWLFS